MIKINDYVVLKNNEQGTVVSLRGSFFKVKNIDEWFDVEDVRKHFNSDKNPELMKNNEYSCDFCECDFTDDFIEVYEKGITKSCCTVCLHKHNEIKPLCLEHWTYTTDDSKCKRCNQ